jgi:general secretion pathway protein D
VNIISSLDIPFSDREMTIIPIQYASAEDIAGKLEEILGEPNDKQSGANKGSSDMSAIDLIRSRLREASAGQQNNSGQGAGQIAGAAGARASLAVGSRSKAPKIIPDERTNALIIVADDDMTARIRALVSKLDSKFDLSGNRFYVYHCQHASATDLADVLGNLTGSGGSGGGGTGNTSGVFGGDSDMDSLGGSSRTSSSSRRGGSSSRLSNQSRTPGTSRNTSQRRSTSVGGNSGQFGEDLSITADPATNSLIISASKSDYEKLKALLQELDVKRRQVLVEALLLEVSLTGTTDLGTEFLTSGGGKDGGLIARNDLGGLTNLLSDPSKLSGFSLAAASAGSLKLPQGITLPTQAVLLSAAQRNSNVNVLSSPTILATDNQEAEIVVGQNVPFVSSISSNETNLNNTFNQVDRQDVGITLRLTPQISSGDTVTLKIFTEVSSVVGQTANSRLGPTTTVRTSDTTVITKHGQMVVIGGLMADDSNESDEGVPFLKDIPVFGSLFRASTQTRERRNLLIFITPRVIKDQYDSRDVTVERRDEIEKVIGENDMDPRREKVLHDPAIDTVTEAKMFDGEKPSTITAPPAVREEKPVNEAKNVRADVKRRVVNVGQESEIKLSVDSATGVLNRYIVLRAESTVGGLPFAAEDKLVGVELPEGGPALFGADSYGYQVDEELAKFKVIGRFESKEEALKTHKKLPSSWYTLSPYEVMKFGTGPWVNMSKEAKE